MFLAIITLLFLLRPHDLENICYRYMSNVVYVVYIYTLYSGEIALYEGIYFAA
jgi:hypothetical protein